MSFPNKSSHTRQESSSGYDSSYASLSSVKHTDDGTTSTETDINQPTSGQNNTKANLLDDKVVSNESDVSDLDEDFSAIDELLNDGNENIITEQTNVVENKSEERKKHKRHLFFSNCAELMIMNEARSTKNKKATARKYKIQPDSIRQWEQNRLTITAKSMINPHSKTTNRGMVPIYNDLEIKLYDWFEQMQLEDIAVKSNNIIAQAVKINGDNNCNFYDGNADRMKRWVYIWMKRYHLSIRRTTRVGQKLSGHLEAIRLDTIAAINNRFKYGSLENLSPHYFLNMDQTAIYFEGKSKTSIQKRAQ